MDFRSYFHLRNLGLFDVEHGAGDELSERYLDALLRIGRILRTSIIMGYKQISISHVEVICWTEPGAGEKYGYYNVFRLILNEEGQLHCGTLYCHYDGTRNSDVRAKSIQKARERMRVLAPDFIEV